MHCIEGHCPFDGEFPADCPGECCYLRQFARGFTTVDEQNRYPGTKITEVIPKSEKLNTTEGY